MAKELPPLTGHGEIGNGRGTQPDGEATDTPSRGDNVTSTSRGNTSSYLIRRIKRDAADASAANHEAAKAALSGLESGSIKSARAAGIAAGVVRVRSPLQQAVALLGRLSDDELDEVARVIAARRKGGRS